MTSFFGGVRGHQDPELEAANRRNRLRLARDVNDEQTLARAGELPIRRSRHWLLLGVLAAALVAVGFLGSHGGDDVALAPNCRTPGLGLSAGTVRAGDALDFKVAGPDADRYVVTLDGAPIRASGGTEVTYTSTSAGPAFALQQCLSPALRTAAPAGDGPHRLALLRVAPDGTGEQVASAAFTVTGTP